LHFPRLFVVLFGHEKSTEKHYYHWLVQFNFNDQLFRNA
jgi:hypothetical protein